MITKIKIDLSEEQDSELIEIAPLILETSNMQKNLNYIHENF